MVHRKRALLSVEAERRKRRDAWSTMFWASIACICVGWGSYCYERSTGLTIATRSSPGRISTEKSLSWIEGRAFAMTVVALPVMLFSAMKRRQYADPE